jgi:DNA primase
MQPDIEVLKAAHPILDVLRELGLDPVNNRFRCPRPVNHKNGDRTPSVTVRPDRGTFKCWVCPDVRGDVIDLIRLAKNCSFREALDFLRRAGNAPAGSSAPSHASPARSATSRTAGSRVFAQTELFGGGDAFPSAPAPAPQAAPPKAEARRTDGEDEEVRARALTVLLDLCPPVGGKYARYLQKRRIFKRTWDSQKIRMIDDYGAISHKLAAALDGETLARAGLFNPAGHLRFYRHGLLFPYFNRAGKPVYLQARTVDPEAKPKELSLSGPIPLPYNARMLDGEPGHLYLCEGVIDTLTLLEQGFPAVGVPGAANFKPAWAPLFRNKVVHVAFDPDAPGNSGAARAMDLLTAEGVENKRLTPPRGMDLNDWFRKG